MSVYKGVGMSKERNVFVITLRACFIAFLPCSCYVYTDFFSLLPMHLSLLLSYKAPRGHPGGPGVFGSVDSGGGSRRRRGGTRGVGRLVRQHRQLGPSWHINSIGGLAWRSVSMDVAWVALLRQFASIDGPDVVAGSVATRRDEELSEDNDDGDVMLSAWLRHCRGH
jgi:hypothetical protein